MSNFGKTWWGQQWLNSLNNIDYSNRLPRGISYANKGAVKQITIKDNRISAKVAGSRPTPYKVDIILPPFFDPELREFILKLAQRPVIISKLLNRELDPEVLNIAETMGLKVFPKQWTDFKMQCSCPDWAVPCKHLASVIYKLSTEIDNNPFLVFNLHNVNLITELNKLGIKVNKENTKIPKIIDLYFDDKQNKKKEYNTENAYQKLVFSKLTPIHEPLIALLSDFPPFYTGSGNFKEKYSIMLNKVVKNAQKVVQGKISLENLFINAKINELDINHRTSQRITINEEFYSRVLINDNGFLLFDFLYQLSQIPSSKILDYQPSTASLHTVLHFAVHLLANGAVVPQIVQLKNKEYSIRWVPALLCKEVKQLVEKLNNILPPEIFLWETQNKYKEINNNTAFNLLSLFVTELINIFGEFKNEDLFLNLFFRKINYPFIKPGEDALSGGILVWTNKYFITQGKYKPAIAVKELPNEKFLVTINIENTIQKFDLPVSLFDILNLKKYELERYEILQSLTQLSNFIPGLDTYINTNGNKIIELDIETFAPFLIQMIPAIQLLDISILLPKSLQYILKPKASIKIKSKDKNGKSFLRLDQLLDFDWQVAIGDTLMDENEFKKLLQKSDGLIKFKTNYIYVKKEELEKLYKHFTETKELSAFQILRSALSGEYFGAKIELTDEVNKLIKELTDFSDIPLPNGINAQLRPYQKRGYSWMYRNAKIGFGSVIADDMGLGKTIQVIATLQKYKEEGLLENEKALVVVPTGLLSNWEAEIQKFAPLLKTKIFHGTNRKIENNDEYDVLITSYGVMRSDAKNLRKKNWHTLIIDEAQNIKNINTEQTKAIKSIPANNFIAMSGTPVENRLSELWSIVDYSNRGFLGSLKEFNDTYGNPIQQYNDIEVAEKLKKVTSPFLMRRLKSDKSIISDLPDKIEMDCFATLAKEQASLYENTLQNALNEIEGITATDHKSLFVRQGLVLQMILALKQICNHPTQFLKNNVLDASLSGKLDLLFDKLDSITESNEKVLVFTQFTEMGKLLKHFITERYKDEPMFYHGGCNIKQRNEMVNNFQTNRAEKIFILSLKAAGTGLNLTAANHVIHYDLWWNPAVETQATDRAYRIGQKSNVMVHRFITKNTFEERINDMIQSKKHLAEITVATGENWIGNLSNRELRNIFELGK
ncbi:MAG: helicase SNF2 [Bacteroidetes bacterium CG02_land_8_20_14_3_00_31_25]|nr:DEAD/DEAH box helicase [Bacteroidota bacterium]PIV63072.1 MAG: helicase SNF2 [Bacteroidetes bacterium CG02_land_8_20_14_3_00_31_25]PIX32656.1 MAG: helicase SNF2 [Bacteroidetes bacterium CG_4_8_14_3_um_filter_31_14]PIY03023.1 MAG: helicase SNF2 [Bacteroidetes bacterium CG_4_10_14_3_um_filter_31_20]